MDQETYQYFDIEAIMDSVPFKPEDIKIGQRRSLSKDYTIDQMETGFTTSSDEMICLISASGKEKGRVFDSRIMFTRDKVLNMECDCPSCSRRGYNWYNSENRSCPNMAAFLIKAAYILQKQPVGDATDKTASSLLDILASQRANLVVAKTEKKDQSLGIEPQLHLKDGALTLGFKIVSGKSFVIKDMMEFVSHIDNSETATYGSSTEINHQIGNFTQRAKEWIDYIRQVVQEENRLQQRICEATERYGDVKQKKCSALELYGWRLDSFYEVVGTSVVAYDGVTDAGKEKRSLTCREDRPQITLTIRPDVTENTTGSGSAKRLSSLSSVRKKGPVFHGVQVICKMPDFFIGTKSLYYVKDSYFCKTDRASFSSLEPLLDMTNRGNLSFRIGRNKLAEFYYSVLPQLGDAVNVIEEEPDLIQEYLPPEVTFCFYLDAEDGDILCRVHALYNNGATEVSALDELFGDKKIESFRMADRENEIAYRTSMLLPLYIKDSDELACGQDEDLIYQMLEHGVDDLASLGEVKATRRFQNLNVIRKVKVNIGVSVESNLLDLDIETDSLSSRELLEVLKSYHLKKKYFRLKNGSFLNLEDPGLLMLSELLTTMQIPDKEFLKGHVKLPIFRTLYLNRLLEDNDDVYNTRDARFREMVKNFKTVQEADFEIPKGLQGTMRSYQVTGYKWLRTLGSCGFGGILADEMGLGKTLQSIAVLLAGKEEGQTGTSLIVSPASLVYNWCEEFARFAPDLRVLAITGTQAERKLKLADWTKYDVLVTSYDLLRRDITEYEGKSFGVQIIDEAQYIKNHTTAAAKAVKVVQANQRYALTGTPIENRLSELWSIFDFLMPGFLYRYDTFRREFEIPIVKNEDKDAMSRLQKLTGPFILRRLKGDVLRELPDKLEESRYIRMEGEQRKLYDAQALRIQKALKGQTSEEFQKHKIQLLADLTRLRQICCDPSLCFEKYSGESAKLEGCIELVESAIDGGHKILLFSQFTSMLEIIEKRLELEGIQYYCITGATPKEQRLQLVKAFNSDNVPVFLISLRAGGVGLNLTGADVVIHYDPWWNLAAQNQATDRAHRIGQTKKVTVYKLIASRSIEEKIEKLQESKKELAEQVLNAGEGQLTSMSKEDLLDLLQT